MSEVKVLGVEIKAKKIQIENSIRDIVSNFENETGLFIDSVAMETKYSPIADKMKAARVFKIIFSI